MPAAHVSAQPSSAASRPIIGVTADVSSEKFQSGCAYARMIERAGGLPVILPCVPALASEFLRVCDGVVLSGGDDPMMTRWGVPMHPKAKAIHPDRQAFELALLAALDDEPKLPVLGVCLGMQLMGLHAGGTLDQHLPDSLPSATMHWDQGMHEIEGELGTGIVHSHHRQALTDAGSLKVIARAPDGVIEAVQRANSGGGGRTRMYVGVQWHPERTENESLGFELFARLVREARAVAVDR